MPAGRDAKITSAPATPLRTWAPQCPTAWGSWVLAPSSAPKVTAGLRWPPLMAAVAVIITTSASPWARATGTRLAAPRGAVTAMAPTPAKMSVKVPMNSAIIALPSACQTVVAPADLKEGESRPGLVSERLSSVATAARRFAPGLASPASVDGLLMAMRRDFRASVAMSPSAWTYVSSSDWRRTVPEDSQAVGGCQPLLTVLTGLTDAVRLYSGSR